MIEPEAHTYRIGVDIGGTFTDVVLVGPDGVLCARKIPTTPQDYSRALVQGMVEACAAAGVRTTQVAEVVHGTTIVTNAIIEQTGARVGLITTKGFRDVLEIGRGRLPAIYDLSFRKPPPLVPRSRRLEVDERVNGRGEVLKPLDPGELDGVIQELLALEVRSVAVCLLNAPLNPTHERMVGDALRMRAPHLPVSLSTEVMPLLMEYERTSETVLNAYVTPLVADYLRRLSGELKAAGFTAPLYIIQSSGGMTTPEASARRPIEIIECGPAAGVVGAAFLAGREGDGDLVAFDMGGTTAKASLVEGGAFTRSVEYEVGGALHRASRLLKGSGYPLRVPSIDIAEVGAGGGSLLGIDLGGAVRIGPRSAGADPGPVCYGRGGEIATLTDADVVLGYINPDHLCGGDFPLDPERARAALDRAIAEPLGKDVHEAALAVHTLANAHMMRAIRAVSSERGRDPRRFRLYAYGGAGPVHAAGVAAGLDIRSVVVPPIPGLFSAYGLLCADLQRHYVRHLSRPWAEAALDEVNAGFAGMAAEALASVTEWAGRTPRTPRLEWSLDLMYEGQGSALEVPAPRGELTAADVAAVADRFEAAHWRDYGHVLDGLELRLKALRLVATLPSRPAPAPRLAPRARPGAGVPRRGARHAFWGDGHGLLATPVLSLDDLGDAPFKGPALIDGYDTTIVVPPGVTAAAVRGGVLLALPGRGADDA